MAVIAPSGPVLQPSLVRRSTSWLEQQGLHVHYGPHLFDVRGYLAGTDDDRAADLLWALESDAIDAVFCARGGYGAQRTVAALDRGRIRQLRDSPPKAFVGFSDITVLHALIRHELHWVTFYGPVMTSLARATPYTEGAFLSALWGAEALAIGPNPDDPYVETLVGGTGEGTLAGGCLTLLAALAGTPDQVDFDGAVAFFEEVGEEPYRVDRAISQLLAAGCFEGVRGIVVGEHTDCRPQANSLGLEAVFEELLVPLGVPCIATLPLGHGRHQATLPLGATARLDADAQLLTVAGPSGAI